MARGLLAEGRAPDVARMLEPLVAPVPDQASGALDAGQLVLRCLLAQVRLLRYGDATRALALLKPFDAPALREALEPAVRAEVALWLGWSHTWPCAALYDDARALNLLDEAERLFHRAMNTTGRCWALLGKAHAYFAIDEYPLMVQALHEAAALQAKIEDAQAALWTLDLHVLGAHLQGRYAQALTYAEALKEQAQHVDDAFVLSRARAYQAVLYDALGRPPAVIVEAASEAATGLQRAATKPGHLLMATFRAHLGAEIRRGAWGRAEKLIDHALTATSDQPTASTHLLLQRARMDLRRGRYTQTEALLQDLDAQMPRLQHRLLASGVALVWCELRQRQHRWEEAYQWAQRAYGIARETGHQDRQLRALLYLAKISLAQGREDAARDHLGDAQSYNNSFSVLPVAALRFTVLGEFALAEDNAEEARPYFAQALSAYTLVGDAYRIAQVQVKLAALERLPHPVHARALLEAAVHTFDRLHAHPEGDETRALLDAWPVDREPDLESDEINIGASLAQASLSVDLIAETWLNAAARLLPDRWLGLYRCDEGHPWMCVRERGEAPVVPNFYEPCGPQLFADDVFWLRLRGHPGPAFFFGVALTDRDDPAWQAAYARIKPWLPVASLALEHALLRAERLDAAYGRDGAPRIEPVLPLQGFVYASPAMREVVGQIHRIHASHSPVLITGERGVGKALLARAVHALSERNEAPFLTFACDTVAGELVESHLFGRKDETPGALQASDGGTLFLAHVDALPLGMQRKLLRFLREGVVIPLGARDPVPINIRFVASTSQDLKALIREGRFLEDLCYRLGVIPLHVPPLRERREEIPLLVQHFLNALRPPGTPLPTLTNRAVEALLHYDWPGNVRQLHNEIERLFVFAGSEPAPLIDVKDLSPTIVDASGSPELLASAQEAILKPGHALDQVLAGTEKVLIERVLAEHHGQVTASANALGLTRQGLYKKMKRLGIDAAARKT